MSEQENLKGIIKNTLTKKQIYKQAAIWSIAAIGLISVSGSPLLVRKDCQEALDIIEAYYAERGECIEVKYEGGPCFVFRDVGQGKIKRTKAIGEMYEDLARSFMDDKYIPIYIRDENLSLTLCEK